MSYSPEDDEPEFPVKQPGRYRFSNSLCECDMCDANPAQDSELDKDDIE